MKNKKGNEKNPSPCKTDVIAVTLQSSSRETERDFSASSVVCANGEGGKMATQESEATEPTVSNGEVK